jgi:hypothetical protein
LNELDGPLGKQYRDAVDDWELTGTIDATDSLCLKLQGLVADRTDEPAKVVCGQGAEAHGSIVTKCAVGCGTDVAIPWKR